MTTTLITRADYMNDSSNLHQAYFAQFITTATRNFIESRIGIKKLLTSECKHLNDLFSHSQGGRGTWVWDSTPVNMELIRELGDAISPSTHTCVGKACAKIMLDEVKLSYRR